MSLSKTSTERKETQFLQRITEVETRKDFPMLWNTMYDFKEKQEIASDVVTFYGHNYDKMGARASFSNFFIHEEVPFTIPDVCWNKMEQKLQSEGDSQLPPRTVMISFSEKSIMLCKAAVFGDKATYLQILNADCPALCKVLGRRVSPFDERLWQKVILEVAFEVVSLFTAGIFGLVSINLLINSSFFFCVSFSEAVPDFSWFSLTIGWILES